MILKKMVDTLLALIIGLLAAYALVCLYAFFLGDYFLFATQPPTYTLGGDYKTILSAKGRQIPFIYLAAPNARYTILYSHGNLEDIGFIRPRLESYRKHGYNIMGYDYPGFGAANGNKGEQDVFDAADAAYNYLINTLHFAPSQILLYGRSMGGGPNAYLAAKHAVAGVVMHSTFVSAYRVQTGIKLLPWDRFDNLSRIPQIKSPLLFVHGLADETIPVWHTRMMMAAAKSPTMSLMVPYALHNNVIEIAQDTYWETLQSFLSLIEKSRGFSQPEEKIETPVPAPAPIIIAAPTTATLPTQK